MWKTKHKTNPNPRRRGLIKQLKEVKGEKTTEEAQVLFAKFLYANPYLAIKLLTGVEIARFQEIAMRIFMVKDYCLNVWGRASSKSFLIAAFIPFYAVFNPGTKIVITAKNARQTRAIFRQIEKWYEDKSKGKHLRDCVKRFSRNPDGWIIEFKNGSDAIFLPLGGGDAIRGMRANLLIVDEFLLMDEGVFNTVIRPFMMAKSSESLSNEKVQKAEDILVKHGKMKDSDRTPSINNKLIILSSASYKFEYLYEVYKDYLNKIYPEKEDLEGSNDHAIYKMSWEAVKHEPFLDQKAIMEASKTMSSQQFEREMCARFLDDSGGYFSAKKMKACTVPSGEHPTVKIQGDKDKDYILALDPNYSDSETADNFGMAVIELDRENDKAYLVHGYALAKSDIIKRGQYVNYLLNNFNIVYIIADNAGGSKFFNDIGTLNLLQKPVKSFEADYDDDDKIRGTKSRYNLSTGSILHLQQFGGKRGWVREANEHLQYLIENKKVWFAAPVFNEHDLKVAMGLKVPIDELFFQKEEMESDYRKMTNFGKMKQSDFIDHQAYIIAETQRECALVEMSSTSTGSQKFDLPVNLSKDKSPDRARKDSYTVLLLACWGWNCYKQLESTEKKAGRRIFTPQFIG